MRGFRSGLKVKDIATRVLENRTVSIPYHDPEDFLRATEVRAYKDRRYADTTTAPIIAHAGDAIDDDFGIVDPGRCRNRLDGCKRGGSDDPMNGLHDDLPLAGAECPRTEDIASGLRDWSRPWPGWFNAGQAALVNLCGGGPTDK